VVGVGASVVRSADTDFRAGGLRFSSCVSFLSLPGVLGVLLALPKPKAPFPRLKDAEPLALVGEATAAGELKAFLLLMLPTRLADGVEL